MNEENDSRTLCITKSGAAIFSTDQIEIKIAPGGAMVIKASNDVDVATTTAIVNAITTIIDLQNRCIGFKSNYTPLAGLEKL